MARVPGGWLDDGSPRLQQSAPLGVLDHPEPDAVLHAAARIQGLDLGQDRRAKPGGDAMEPHQRRVPDGPQAAAQGLGWAPLYAENRPQFRGGRGAEHASVANSQLVYDAMADVGVQ